MASALGSSGLGAERAAGSLWSPLAADELLAFSPVGGTGAPGSANAPASLVGQAGRVTVGQPGGGLGAAVSSPEPRRPSRLARLLPVAGMLLLTLVPGCVSPAAADSSAPRETLAFTGKAVNFNLSGVEPDFDPIYRVVISGRLHDGRAEDDLPDSTLILSAYLEVFQPDTTPILPDLLHPDQVAQDLAGFLSGKAALVNKGGHVAYQGSLLAEIFQNNDEHIVLDLSRTATGPTVRLEGAISLSTGGAERGTLRAQDRLALPALAVPPGRIPSWQQVISAISVRRPVMMGTAAPAGTRTSAAPSTIAPAALANMRVPVTSRSLPSPLPRPATFVLLALGFMVACAGIALSLSHRHDGFCRRPGASS